jgi:hypothetical protein
VISTEKQPFKQQHAPEALKLYSFCYLTVQTSTVVTSRIGGRIRRQRCSVQLLVEILRSPQLLLFHGAVDVVRALEFAGQSRRGHVVNYLVRSWMTSYAFLGIRIWWDRIASSNKLWRLRSRTNTSALWSSD